MTWTTYTDATTTYSSALMPWNGMDSTNPSGGTLCAGGETLKRITTRTNTFMDDILSLFKQHARIDWVDDDRLCKLYLNSAISRIEQFLELPITPATYEWNAESKVTCHDCIELPFRNTTLDGKQFDFELLRGKKVVDKPTTWPMTLEVGFTSGDDIPDDLLLSIFELALGLYELRSNSEMTNIYARDIMAGNLSRYWVARV